MFNKFVNKNENDGSANTGIKRLKIPIVAKKSLKQIINPV